MIELEIRDLPKLPNAMKGWHWAKVHRYRMEWHWMVRAAIGGTMREPLVQGKVVLTRFSTTEPDEDNLAASWKPVIDGLVVSNVLVDDSPAHMILDSRWSHAPRGKGRITIQVKEALEDDDG